MKSVYISTSVSTSNGHMNLICVILIFRLMVALAFLSSTQVCPTIFFLGVCVGGGGGLQLEEEKTPQPVRKSLSHLIRCLLCLMGNIFYSWSQVLKYFVLSFSLHFFLRLTCIDVMMSVHVCVCSDFRQALMTHCTNSQLPEAGCRAQLVDNYSSCVVITCFPPILASKWNVTLAEIT